jgi:hypothetical protein
LSKLETFDERFDYLKIGGEVGHSTFGFDRWVNQQFYASSQWKDVRQHVILRDNGCDLGVPGYEIHSGILVHHLNPMVADDILHAEAWIIDPDFLITTTQDTHNAIHYGTRELLKKPYVARKRGDTRLW